jgi:hypothetical protein
VGFVQYQVILFFLITVWFPRHLERLRHDPWLCASLAGYFGWMTMFDIVYWYRAGTLSTVGPWARLEGLVGLPTFVLGMFLLVRLLGADAKQGSYDELSNNGDAAHAT